MFMTYILPSKGQMIDTMMYCRLMVAIQDDPCEGSRARGSS